MLDSTFKMRRSDVKLIPMMYGQQWHELRTSSNCYVSQHIMHGLDYCMKDIRRAFPKTQLTDEYKGQVFLILPAILGFGDGVMGEMLTFIEGFQPSNHAFDVNVRKALELHGFKLCPSDDQLITKEEFDGHFIMACKVVDNFLIVATNEKLTRELEGAIASAGYDITAEANDKFIGIQLERMSNNDIHAHQGRHAKELMRKYGITRTALTPLSSAFTRENYVCLYLLQTTKQ